MVDKIAGWLTSLDIGQLWGIAVAFIMSHLTTIGTLFIYLVRSKAKNYNVDAAIAKSKNETIKENAEMITSAVDSFKDCILKRLDNIEGNLIAKQDAATKERLKTIEACMDEAVKAADELNEADAFNIDKAIEELI